MSQMPQNSQADLIPGQNWIEVYAPMGLPPVFYRYDSEFKELFENISLEFGSNDV